MSDAIKDAILPVLIKIQEDAAAFRVESRERFDRIEARLDRIETRLDRLEEVARKQRRDIAGILVMMKGAAGVFDERITTMEQRVDALEQRQGLS